MISSKQKQSDTDYSIYCLLAGFFITYLLFYVGPTFFFGASEMRSQADFPAIIPIGADLVRNMKRCGRILDSMGNDFKSFAFSPFYVLVLGALSKLPDTVARWLIALISIMSFAVSCVCIPRWLSGQKQFYPASIFVMAVGFTSYGLKFDLERGQWNLPVFLFCLSAVVLWHTNKKANQFIAVALYIMATHLKLWPIIFGFCFINPELGWKKNFKFLCLIEFANFMFLFVLGAAFFMKYFQIIIDTLPTMKNYGSVNHSIASFSYLIEQKYGDIGQAVRSSFYIISCLCFLSIAFTAFREKKNGSDIYVIFACTLAAMLLPKISHDYKLVILTVVVSIFFSLYRFTHSSWKLIKYLEIISLTAISILYHITLYSNWHKKIIGFFTPNTPVLLSILIIITLLSLLHNVNIQTYITKLIILKKRQ